MALITCPDCKTEISDAAPACVKCGRPMQTAPASAVQTVKLGFWQDPNIGCVAAGILVLVLAFAAIAAWRAVHP